MSKATTKVTVVASFHIYGYYDDYDGFYYLYYVRLPLISIGQIIKR